MRKYKPRVERIMGERYTLLDPCRLALGLVEDNSRVLSAGCGSGREVKFLVEKGCIVTAVDINKKFLDKSKRAEPRAKYILGDLANFDLSDEFDYILCLWNTINAIEGFENRRKFINKCYDNLKENGCLIITTKSFIQGFIPLNDYTIASYEVNSFFRDWFGQRDFFVEKIKIDGVWLIIARRK